MDVTSRHNISILFTKPNRLSLCDECLAMLARVLSIFVVFTVFSLCMSSPTQDCRMCCQQREIGLNSSGPRRLCKLDEQPADELKDNRIYVSAAYAT